MSNFTSTQISDHVRALEKQGLSGKALEDRIYADAKSKGVTSGQIENALGMSAGTVSNWTKSNNKSALLGGHGKAVNDYTPKSGSYSSKEVKQHVSALGQNANGYLDHEMQIYRDAAQRGMSESELEQAMGWNAGTVKQWTNQHGLDPLTGYAVETPAITTRGVPQTPWNNGMMSANRLDEMLASNSPLMQRAATQGRQVANARGLLNSSMAAEASQGAMIDRATPFALQDAQTTYQHDHRNTDRQQQAYMANLNYQNQRGLNEQQYGFQRGLNDQSYQQQRGLNEQNYGFDMGRQQQQHANQKDLNAQQFNNEMQRMGYAYELDQRNVPQNYASNISATTLQNIQSIQADPNLEPPAKQAAIKNVIDMANANLSWAEAFYNTPMPSMRAPGAA